MNFSRTLILLILVIFSMTSCLVTDNIRTTQIEIMKPGIFIFPDSINRVAIFNRDIYKTDTCTFEYKDGIKDFKDSTISYNKLANKSIEELTNFLKQEGYFAEVRNYGDSLNSFLKSNEYYNNPNELFERTNSDICIFLDYFHFNNSFFAYHYNYLYTEAALSWTIGFKHDSAAYVYNQIDTLDFDDSENPEYSLKKGSSEKMLNKTAQYLGKYFGTKIIPTWLAVDRIYYRSNNVNMLKAEKIAINGDWYSAAEIWNKETKSKNQKIAAKACYNMALACEMEGKLDLAIDWLVKSYGVLKNNNEEHKANCQKYINILAIRKKEIQRLDKQVRN